MAGSVKSLVLLAFSGSLGVMFLVLGCALPQFGNWIPFVLIVFYILAPVPYSIARGHESSTAGGGGGVCMEVAVFLTTGVVISALALPFVLAHAPVGAPTIAWGACALSTVGTVIMFATIYGFFRSFDDSGSTPFY